MTGRTRALALVRRFETLLRYYGVGLVNTAFGYASYLVLVTAGLNMFVAQLIAHVLGTAFNYVMFRRHVFRTSRPAPGRYVLAYAGNYLLSLALLWSFSRLVHSPALAGLLTLVAASAINYLVLRRFVFNRAVAG